MSLTTIDLPAYLMSSIRLTDSNGPAYMRAGHAVNDLVTATNVINAGGVLLPAFMSLYSAAASKCASLYAQGANDDVLDRVMRGAVDRYSAGCLFTSDFTDMTTEVAVQLFPFLSPRRLTVTDAFFVVSVQTTATESDVVFIELNNVELSPSTRFTYNHSSLANTRITFPNMAGLQLKTGDQLATNDIYTPGSSQNLPGQACAAFIYAV